MTGSGRFLAEVKIDACWLVSGKERDHRRRALDARRLFARHGLDWLVSHGMNDENDDAFIVARD